MREMKKKIKQTHMKQPSLCDIENHEGSNEAHLRVTNVGTTLAWKSIKISPKTESLRYQAGSSEPQRSSVFQQHLSPLRYKVH